MTTCAAQGYQFTNLSVDGEPNVVCQVPVQTDPPFWQAVPYIWVIISLACASFLIAITW